MLFKFLSFYLPMVILSATGIEHDNMNGDIYGISNMKEDYSTQFKDISPDAEYFDVYSPVITSQYAEVYWTMMEPVPLPKNIVDRFNNSVMAILGYETDQVFPGDISVPITWSYNHHYETYLQGANTQLVNVKNKTTDWGKWNHGSHEMWKIITDEPITPDSIPQSQFFSEANGGESRGSFHGYPHNMAQLIKSPQLFRIQPMQIDTRNRNPKYINDTLYHAGLLPKESVAPKDAIYSGLLECPCTNRIKKVIYHYYPHQLQGVCPRNINNITICKKEAAKYGIRDFNIVNSSNLPYGCSFNHTNINYNLFRLKTTCDTHNNIYSAQINLNSLPVKFKIKINNTKVNMKISGPEDKWFGIAFNAHAMSDLPYTIIISDNIKEYKLGNHDPGIMLNNSINIVSNTILNGIRIVELERNVIGLTKDHYTFTTLGELPILGALGKSIEYAYHHKKTGGTLSFISLNGNTCICDNGISGTIDGLPFSKNCAKEPKADLFHQHNPTCFIDTYKGGLSCCHHKTILLDKEQTPPSHLMSYRIKFRFWFKEYLKQESLVRLYFQTEAYAGEYDVPICHPPNECIHMIRSKWQAHEMIDKQFIQNNSGVKLIYAAPHCHAPSCISMELYNEDTGDLICRVDSKIGKGTTRPFDEKGYIRLDPCIWGYEQGLYNPPIFKWNTNLSSVKRNNNKNSHLGEMASWQMRGVVI